MHAQAHLGVLSQLSLHLTLINLAVRPMLLTFGHTSAVDSNQRRSLCYLFAVFRVNGPVGTQCQGDTVAVLPVYQHVFVHQ